MFEFKLIVGCAWGFKCYPSVCDISKSHAKFKEKEKLHITVIIAMKNLLFFVDMKAMGFFAITNIRY